MNVAWTIVGLVFWSVVQAFVPSVLYIVLKESWRHKEQTARSKGIFMVMKESERRKLHWEYLRGIFVIYGICLLIFSVIYGINWVRHEKLSVEPFDILSASSVVFFWFSVLSYLPVLFLFAWKHPERYEEEIGRFQGPFMYYGIGLLIFSIMYSYRWMKGREIPLAAREILTSFGIILFSSAVLAYLPIVTYLLIKTVYSDRNRRKLTIHVNEVFVIYSICFLIFSGIYIYEWVCHKGMGKIMP